MSRVKTADDRADQAGGGASWSENEADEAAIGTWPLQEQVGFLLRRAQQRHLAIFAERVPELTPTQFSAMVTLAQEGALSQNELGRRTAMDTATIKGVVDRLRARGLVDTWKDDLDRRRIAIRLTSAGATLIEAQIGPACDVTAATLAPLTKAESATLIRLLKRMS